MLTYITRSPIQVGLVADQIRAPVLKDEAEPLRWRRGEIEGNVGGRLRRRSLHPERRERRICLTDLSLNQPEKPRTDRVTDFSKLFRLDLARTANLDLVNVLVGRMKASPCAKQRVLMLVQVTT